MLKKLLYNSCFIVIALIIEINLMLYKIHINIKIKNKKELSSWFLLLQSGITERLVYAFENLKHRIEA